MVPEVFYGWRVVAAAFVLAVFGWGAGFYGPPVYLHAVREARGWSLTLTSTAITVHFLFGSLVIANLPRLYRRFGVPLVTKAGAISLSLGVLGFALANSNWEIFLATLLSGSGWVAMSAAAVNAIVSTWFIRTRAAALSAAYNGASIGGVVFSPLWVAVIDWLGFPLAAAVIGLVMIVVTWVLADIYFSKTPQQMGMAPDGDTPRMGAEPAAGGLVQRTFWNDIRFVTLAAGMALGLFAQIGLLAHLFSLLVPAFGAQLAGFATGAATIAAIGGRSAVGWWMPPGVDRRLVACASYGVQVVGSIALLLAAGSQIPLLLIGVVLFGLGIGNATSLPPLIAQAEFAPHEVARAVPLIIAISQAAYAFAPAVFGLIRAFGPGSDGVSAPWLFIVAALIQAASIGVLLMGRPVPGLRQATER